MYLSDEQKTARFSEMLCFLLRFVFSCHVVCIFILALYKWCNKDVGSMYFIPTPRHTEVVTVVIFRIKKIR